MWSPMSKLFIKDQMANKITTGFFYFAQICTVWMGSTKLHLENIIHISKNH